MLRPAAITRRGFLGSVAALGALGVAACAAPGRSPETARRGADGLPEQGEYLIRDAYVMTLHPGAADLPVGRVHVRRGEIVAVGAGVEAPGAQTIDGRG